MCVNLSRAKDLTLDAFVTQSSFRDPASIVRFFTPLGMTAGLHINKLS
jgi:hypothetical protein